MMYDVLFIGDAWETLDHPRDSTLYLAEFAEIRFGARCFWGVPGALAFEDGELQIELRGALSRKQLVPLRAEESRKKLSLFHSVHWRADPPVDLATMRLWSLLVAAGAQKFFNPPRALLEWNEKFAPLRFMEWAVPSVVSDSEAAWKRFHESGRLKDAKLIAKPSGDAASRGVQFLPGAWDEALVALRRMRAQSGPWLVLQEFASELLEKGETRAFIVGSKVIATLSKKPHAKYPIMSLDAPASERPTLQVCELDPAQQTRAAAVAQALAASGVHLATIDFIGDRILEINVTSAGLISWIDERLPAERKVAQKYWDGLIKLF